MPRRANPDVTQTTIRIRKDRLARLRTATRHREDSSEYDRDKASNSAIIGEALDLWFRKHGERHGVG